MGQRGPVSLFTLAYTADLHKVVPLKFNRPEGRCSYLFLWHHDRMEIISMFTVMFFCRFCRPFLRTKHELNILFIDFFFQCLSEFELLFHSSVQENITMLNSFIWFSLFTSPQKKLGQHGKHKYNKMQWFERLPLRPPTHSKIPYNTIRPYNKAFHYFATLPLHLTTLKRHSGIENTKQWSVLIDFFVKKKNSMQTHLIVYNNAGHHCHIFHFTFSLHCFWALGRLWPWAHCAHFFQKKRGKDISSKEVLSGISECKSIL